MPEQVCDSVMEQICDGQPSDGRNNQQQRRGKRSPFIGELIKAKERVLSFLFQKLTGWNGRQYRQSPRRPRLRTEQRRVARRQQAVSTGSQSSRQTQRQISRPTLQCRSEPKQRCSTQMRKKCRTEQVSRPQRSCGFVPRERCEVVEKNQCVPVSERKCENIPREKCQNIPRQQCKGKIQMDKFSDLILHRIQIFQKKSVKWCQELTAKVCLNKHAKVKFVIS